jgi:hypothetical protein
MVEPRWCSGQHWFSTNTEPCDSITRQCNGATQGGDMNIERLDGPIEPQSAIMKGN